MAALLPAAFGSRAARQDLPSRDRQSDCVTPSRPKPPAMKPVEPPATDQIVEVTQARGRVTGRQATPSRDVQSAS